MSRCGGIEYMRKVIVALVGRPNVGKSTLFNRLAGEMISIVEDTPGVTRDRVYADSDWNGREFSIIDTGGLDPDSDDVIVKQMYRQAEIAMETADVILFITDVKQGVTAADQEVANVLRKTKKPVILLVNKVDNMHEVNTGVFEFYNLALGEPIPLSANQGLGIGDMLDELVARFPDFGQAEDEDDAIKVAVIGKPNAGKSSLINRIIGQERLIVSDIPGTTRDAIDTHCKINGQKYTFIDTAGIRRKSKIKENIERYSIVRAIAAIERCDVAVLLIDATEGVTEQDTKIAGIAHERGRAAVIAINKWDMIEKDDKTMNKYLKSVESEFSYMSYAPKVFISVLSGQRVHKLIETIKAVAINHCQRVSTGVLNDVLIEATSAVQPPQDKGKSLKIFYMTQASVKPPTFVMFINDKQLFHFSYKRYLENRIRDAFGFSGTPIHFILREKTK